MVRTEVLTALRHVVLFRVHDDCRDADVEEMVHQLRALGDGPGILSWRVELSLDERKGRVIVEDATFASQEALETFRRSEAHVVTAERMSTMADWLIGNYWCADDEVPGRCRD